MLEISSTLLFELQPGETAPLRIARNACLQVRHAMVWLTREGEPTDHWLDDGQSLAVRARDTLWLTNDGRHPAWIELRHHDGAALLPHHGHNGQRGAQESTTFSRTVKDRCCCALTVFTTEGGRIR